MVTLYHGVVRGSVVVLTGDAQLEEGTRVEVRLIGDGTQDREPDDSLELKQSLISSGLLEDVKPPLLAPVEGDRTPAVVKGKPMSQMVIEDRR